MASIAPAGIWGCPRCEGCGEELFVLHHALDSSVRLPFTPEAAWRGSYGAHVAEFAAKHAMCPEPYRELTAAGVLIVDRRRL